MLIMQAKLMHIQRTIVGLIALSMAESEFEHFLHEFAMQKNDPAPACHVNL